MNFIIKETSSKETQKNINEIYKKVKKDYLNGMSVNDLKKKYDINSKQWVRDYIPLIKEDNIYRKKKHL